MQGNHTRITRNSFPPIHPHTNATLRTPPLTFPIHPVRKIAFTIYVSSYTWRWFNNPESWPWKTVTFFSSCGIILSPPPSIDLHPFRKQRATGGKQTAAKNETKRNETSDDSQTILFSFFVALLQGAASHGWRAWSTRNSAQRCNCRACWNYPSARGFTASNGIGARPVSSSSARTSG